jgi:hypothetical protein
MAKKFTWKVWLRANLLTKLKMPRTLVYEQPLTVS